MAEVLAGSSEVRATATDELRRMLTERGVEWEKPLSIMSQIKTVWRDGPWEYTAVETSGGEFSIYVEHRYWLTPEQAIAATLGRWECEVEEVQSGAGWVEFQCSSCGSNRIDKHDNYCPNCGAKVVDK